MKSFKNVIHTIGDETEDIAKRFGRGTVDVAKRVGDSSVDLARRIGPVRGLIGLAVIGAATVGVVYLVRYLRARSAEMADEEGRFSADPKQSKRNPKRTDAAQPMH